MSNSKGALSSESLRGDDDFYLRNSENKKLIGKRGATILKPSEDETPREETSTRSNRRLITSDEENNKETKKSRRRSNLRGKESGVVNSAYESDTQLDKEKPKKKKNTKSQKSIVTNDPTILAVIVHQSDKLRTDINLYHPIVRVHLLDLDMDGQYVKKTNKERNTLIYYEKESRKLDFVSPITTTPFDFKKNRSVIPKWEEIIVFNESFQHFVQNKPNVLVMFEIIDSLKNDENESADVSNAKTQYTSQDTGSSWQRVAWAFLKLVGANNALNVEKKVRLQLYYCQTHYKVKSSDSSVPEVFHLYKNGLRIKYPASLHVTVKSILPPASFEPGIRSFHYLNENRIGKEGLIENGEENKTVEKIEETHLNSTNKLIQEFNVQNTKRLQKTAIWTRVAGMPCRIPNDEALKLSAAKNGCYSIKFSTSGSYLACACVEDNNVSPIYIYDIPDGRLVMKFQGHFGLVYEMSWSRLDRFIATASNDATARIIDVESRSKEAYKILPHPSFLYSVKFHPNSSDLVVTGGYDKVIRVWLISGSLPGRQSNDKYGQLLQELRGHSGYVNALCFSSDGNSLFSADSAGRIKCWTTPLKSEPKSIEWFLKNEIEVEELKGQIISHVHLHPNQFRMVVHLRNNNLKLIDVRIQSVVKNYKNAFNFNLNIRSAISPCGTFLFCAGPDTKLYCWNIDTGDQLITTGITLNYLKPARDIDFHPYDNLIALCSLHPHTPIYIFKYNPDKAQRDLNEIPANATTQLSRQYMTMETSVNRDFLLPNQTDTSVNQDQANKRYTEDLAKFNLAQTNRWKKVQEKLDSVHPPLQSLNSSRNLNYLDTLGFNKQSLAGSITLEMNDLNRPEFKYKGPKEAQDFVVALYDYSAQRSDELDLFKGDEVLVLVRENENWWMGELVRNKKQGYFPANYVQEKQSFNLNEIIPKIPMKDVTSEYEKVYESNPLKQIKPRKINDVKKESREESGKLDEERLRPIPRMTSRRKERSAENNRKPNADREENVKTEESNDDAINEEPTRDRPKQTPKRRPNSSRSGAFAHLINGTHADSSEI